MTRRTALRAGIMCLLCTAASGEPHRLGMHANPLGAMVDDCPVYPRVPGGDHVLPEYLPAWDSDDRYLPFRLLGARETVLKTGSGDEDLEGIPAVEREFRQGRARFTIQVESGSWFAPEDAFREIVRVLAVMPGTLTQRLPHTYIQVVDHLGRRAGGLASFEIEHSTPLHHRILDDGSIWWWRTEPLGVFFRVRLLASLGLIEPGSIFDSGGGIGRIYPGARPTRQRLAWVMLHELAHVLDYRSRFPGSGHLERNADLRESRIAAVAEGRQSIRDLGFSRSAAWQRAIGESPCAVSEYATTNEWEDFAESVSAWLLYFRLGAAIRDPARFRMMDPLEDWNRWYDEHYSLTKAELVEYRRVLQERLGRRFGVLQRIMHHRFAPFPEVPPS